MFYDFLLVSQKNEEAERIQAELGRNRLYKIRLIDRADQVLKYIQTYKIDCVVFNLSVFTVEKVSFASHLRDCGYNFPVMMFSNNIQLAALEALKKIPKTVMIEKPFESKDVWGIADKLVQGRHVSQRIHRRFYTNQKAHLVHSTTGEELSGRIYNMSHGGAYMEIDSGMIKNGDVLRLRIPLDKFSKSYTVDAKVVWASEHGIWNGKPSCGIQFLKSGDVYRNLIEKL